MADSVFAKEVLYGNHGMLQGFFPFFGTLFL